MTWLDPIVLCVLWCFCASGFNVDTKFPMILSGDKGSYFGYSVSFHNNSEGNIALVTAPKANVSLLGAAVHEPGALYRCRTDIDLCDQVLLERTGNVPRMSGSEHSYHDLKNSSWLGVSLDVQRQEPHHVVTCSHLWKNQLYSNHYLLNGACYVLNKELQWSSTQKLIPLVDRSKQSIIPPGIYYYALGQAGTSAAFSEDGKDLLLGAPGLNDWLGTVVEYKVTPHPRSMNRPVVPNPPHGQGLTPEAYIGYSVTTGHFFELSGMSFVAGAPRDAGNNGTVYIFERLGATKTKIVVQQKFEGGQLGEYFGGSLLSVDLNNNGFSDLLVGAPFHRLKGDEGRVYVFLSDGVGLQLQKGLIMGSSKTFSRFGSSLASAGDLNKDGFQDVIIGAPYEDDGKGAVYIYHGEQNGLNVQYSQRISATEVGNKVHELSGFGISVARAHDADGNHYPDILVGSYASDNAVVLRTRPVVQISARLEFDVTQIDMNVSRCVVRERKVPCFTFRACLTHSGKYVPAILDVLVELAADVNQLRSQPRGLFLRPEGLEDLASMREGLVLQEDRESCVETRVRVLPEEIQDIISPMVFRMNFSLMERDRSRGFCNTCPVLDPATPTSITKQIQFRTGCGEDNTCSADLRVKAHVIGLGEEEPIILGANSSIAVEIRVENTAEPAYSTSLDIVLPPGVQVVNQAKCRLADEPGITLLCNLGNPLRKGYPSVFQIKLDISKLDFRSDEIAIKLSATTASDEINARDNAVLLRIPLRALADITIRGHVDKEQVMFDAKTEVIPIEHTYSIFKYYPSPVESVGVAIYIPIFDRGTKVRIVEIQDVQVSDSGGVPGSCDLSLLNPTVKSLQDQEDALAKGGKDAPNTINLIGYGAGGSAGGLGASPSQQDGGKGYSQVKERKASYVLNCGNAYCLTLMCNVGPFLDSSNVASIRIKANANVTAMTYALGKQRNISLVTAGRVWIRDYDYDPQPFDHRPDEDEASTDFISSDQPAQPIATWIIVVAILAGLLLLLLILLALIKLGFFRREKKEELDKMMQKGSLLAPKGDEDGPQDDDEEEEEETVPRVEEPEDPASEKETDEFDYINFANANT